MDSECNYDEWTLTSLVDNIMCAYHTYIKENIPLLTEFTHKIANVHGERHPELDDMDEYFMIIAQEL